MKKYRVMCKLEVSAYTQVEAGSVEEAMRIASERTVADPPVYQRGQENEEWLVDHDGEPQEIQIDE